VGEFAEGIARGRKGCDCRDGRSPWSLIGALRSLGRLYLRKGDLKEAIAVLERGRELCQVWKFPTWVYGIAANLGYAYVLSGRVADGLPLLEQGLEQPVSMGEPERLCPTGYVSERGLSPGEIEQRTRQLGVQALEFARDHSDGRSSRWLCRFWARSRRIAILRLSKKLKLPSGKPWPSP